MSSYHVTCCSLERNISITRKNGPLYLFLGCKHKMENIEKICDSTEYYVTVSLSLLVPSRAYHYYPTFQLSIRYNHSSRYKHFPFIIYVYSVIYR